MSAFVWLDYSESERRKMLDIVDLFREHDLLVRYGIDDPNFRHDPESIQRLIEGQQLDIRIFLQKYERATEGRRLAIQERGKQFWTARRHANRNSTGWCR